MSSLPDDVVAIIFEEAYERGTLSRGAGYFSCVQPPAASRAIPAHGIPVYKLSGDVLCTELSVGGLFDVPDLIHLELDSSPPAVCGGKMDGMFSYQSFVSYSWS